MKRLVGLMGGTFDPIHIGHLIAAERAMEEIGLDEVRFMPTYSPPHKAPEQGASPEERRELVELAIAGHPSFRLETIELERGGVSYSVDTAAALIEREPNNELFWIIGGDMVDYLPQWHEIERLTSMIKFIGLQRPGYPVRKESIPELYRERIILTEMPEIGISSTDIRERLKRGQSIRYMVPEPVRRRIGERGLYRNGTTKH